jgi:amino acid transporter, AAT family
MTQDREHGLKRQLSAGQVAMVAVGGSIGTGLLLGAGASVRLAGPGVIVSYLIGAVLAYTVTAALGEMASLHPAAGSFGLYAELYLNRWAGFVSRYAYWYSVVIAVGAELVAIATYARYWFPAVPGWVWVIVFAAVLLGINLFSVGEYGATEYWLAMIKVAAIAVFIVIGSVLLAGGRVAAQYTASGFTPHGSTSVLLALPFALFSFLGIEMVAISSGEARSARDVARATAIMFALLTFVYIGAISVLVGVMPWNQAGVTESPFVTVFRLAGLPAASTIVNFIVLTAALSGANANIYVASRMLFSLSRDGYAPTALGQLNQRGAPVRALLASTFGILLAVWLERAVPQSAFLYFLGSSLFGGMLAWWVALAAHVAFRRKLSTDDLARLPMRAPGGAGLSIFGFVGIVAAMIATWWVPDLRICLTSGIPALAVLSVLYWIADRGRNRGEPDQNRVDAGDSPAEPR